MKDERWEMGDGRWEMREKRRSDLGEFKQIGFHLEAELKVGRRFQRLWIPILKETFRVCRDHDVVDAVVLFPSR